MKTDIIYSEPQGREAVINILVERNSMTREDAEKECDSRFYLMED